MTTDKRRRWAAVTALSLGFTTAMGMGFASVALGDEPVDRVTVEVAGEEYRFESNDPEVDLPACDGSSAFGLAFLDGGPVQLILCADKDAGDIGAVFAETNRSGALDLLVNGDVLVGPPASDPGKPVIEVWDGDLNVYAPTSGTDIPRTLGVEASADAEPAILLSEGFLLTVGKEDHPPIVVDVLQGWAPHPDDVEVVDGSEYRHEGGDEPGPGPEPIDARLSVSGEEFNVDSPDLPECGVNDSPFGLVFDGHTPVLTLCGDV